MRRNNCTARRRCILTNTNDLAVEALSIFLRHGLLSDTACVVRQLLDYSGRALCAEKSLSQNALSIRISSIASFAIHL